MSSLYPLPTQSDLADTQNAEMVWDAVMNGATLKELQSIPDHLMDGIYAHAYDFFHKGRYDDAEVFFRFLCFYDMYNADYMLGLAAVYQQLKQYQKAADTYILAFAFAENDFRPMLHAGQCHLFLKSSDQARFCFSTIIDGAAPESLKAQAQAYLSAMKPTQH